MQTNTGRKSRTDWGQCWIWERDREAQTQWITPDLRDGLLPSTSCWSCVEAKICSVPAVQAADEKEDVYRAGRVTDTEAMKILEGSANK